MYKAMVFLLVASCVLVFAKDNRPANLKIAKPYVCAPGESFKLDCNTCRCGPNPGEIGPCTRMACNLSPDECMLGSYFNMDGKLCKCPKNGHKWDSDCFNCL